MTDALLPEPCLDVCKYKIRGGHCIACSMTKMQKAQFARFGSRADQVDFIERLMDQQAQVKSARTWAQEYARKCDRHGVAPPFDLE